MYSKNIIEHFTNPQNIGLLDNYDYDLHIGNPACDDRINLQIKLDEQREKVVNVKYKAYGCATSLATASIFSVFIKGKALEDINTYYHSNDVSELLGELEPKQMHCLDILKELFNKIPVPHVL